MNFTETLQKLKSISLDKDSLKKTIQNLQNKQNIDNAKDKYLKLISKQKTLLIISCSSSFLIALAVLPGSIKNINSNKAIYATYLANIELIKEKSIQSKVEKDFYNELISSQGMIEDMLTTTKKLLYFPELLRKASVKTNIQLLSFKPYEGESDFVQDDFALNAPSANNEIEVPFDELDEIPNELNNPEDELKSINNLGAELSTQEISVMPKIEIDISDFALEVKGKYLNIQRFMGELQGHKLLYSIKEVKYGMAAQGLDSSAGMNSNQRAVQATLIIRLPQRKN